MGGKPKTSTSPDMRLKENKQKYGSSDQRDKAQQQRSLKKGTIVYGYNQKTGASRKQDV